MQKLKLVEINHYYVLIKGDLQSFWKKKNEFLIIV
jgi:hypothetical protein